MATKEETETVITWTSADTMATVYTMHDRIRKRCAKVGTEINLDHGVREGKKVAWTFLVPIDRINVRPPKNTKRTPPNAHRRDETEQKGVLP